MRVGPATAAGPSPAAASVAEPSGLPELRWPGSVPGAMPRAASIVVALVLLFAAMPLSATSTAAGRPASVTSPGSYVGGEVLVRFRPGVTAAEASRIQRGLGASAVKRFDVVPGLRLLRLPPDLGVRAAAAALVRIPQVLYAQPNWMSHIDADPAKTPDDPKYPKQWDWPKIDAPKAWGLTTGSRHVVVGDIDTGMDYKHQDLAANAWSNTKECNGTPGVDDDHNGYVDDCHGIDTIDGDSNPMDDNGHGSHTAGTIGAVGDNGIGVTGLNWRIQVLPCKSHDRAGNGTSASIIECYQYMITEKAAGYDIVSTNNSYGGCPEACDFDRATLDGIKALDRAGILFAVSAGNDSQDNDSFAKYPANYFVPNVIAVAATNRKDGLAYFSNVGDRTVMVGAPGTGILSTVRNDRYASFSGTSMAAPHVAGLAALLHADNPSWTPYQIRNLILSGGDSVASLAGKTVTGDRLDAYGSMTCANKQLFAMVRPLDTIRLKRVRIAVLHIDCADPAGGTYVKITPGNHIKLKLKDDGTQGDLAADDGIYSQWWTPKKTGTYTLTFGNGEQYAVVVA